MVKISDKTPFNEQGQVDLSLWLKTLSRRYPQASFEHLKKHIELAKQWGLSVPAEYADNAFDAGCKMAAILAELNADIEAISAALLYECVNQEAVSLTTLKEHVAPAIVHLIQGALNMRLAADLTEPSQGQADAGKIDRLRKMLLAMINDARVVLVKLADQVLAMRYSKRLPESVKRPLAYSVLHVYAPLANRLGIGQIKWELEDRAFAILHPEEYKHIVTQLDEKRLDRESYLAQIIQTLRDALKAEGVEAEVQGRVKHVYSIWRKMQKKQLSFESLFDIRALRILVRNVQACYEALATVHELFEPVLSEFSDYIATPKSNGYRSIHTIVQGPLHKMIEVQIRTYAMHEESEMGVAAHWRYKEGVAHDAGYESRIHWLRSLLDWQRELSEGDQSPDTLRAHVVEDRIYVFTPQGDVLDLPAGATPVDFAYRIHSDVGHRCRGARVNDRLVQLTSVLNTGDRVEIMTGKESRPSRDWLRQDAGFVKTAHARSKIQYWFRHENKAESAQIGRELFLKALKKAKIDSPDLETLPKAFHLPTLEDFFASIATGDIRIKQAMNRLLPEPISPAEKPVESSEAPVISRRTNDDLVIDGVDNLLFKMAGCCRPVVGDAVMGYITQGKGVSIHRQDCQNFARLETLNADRSVRVTWSQHVRSHYPVTLTVRGEDRPGLLKDITSSLVSLEVSLLRMQSSVSRREGQMTQMTLQVRNTEELAKIMNVLKQVKGVSSVVRS